MSADPWDQIEPAAHKRPAHERPGQETALLSIAISAKRIADAVEAVAKWDGADNALASNILDITYRAGEAFENGKRRAG